MGRPFDSVTGLMISLNASAMRKTADESMASVAYLIESINKNIFDHARRGMYKTTFQLTMSEDNAGLYKKLISHYKGLGYKVLYDGVIWELLITW